MKLALAQIDERMGCLDELAARIEGQALLAAEQGADLLCVPAPLVNGVAPGSLVDYPEFERDVVAVLSRLAADLSDSGVSCLVPAVLGVEGTTFFECFLLRAGRVSPLRLTMIGGRDDLRAVTWSAPIVELDGMRVAISFDLARDCPRLPSGCDVVVHFQVDAFCASDPATYGAAGMEESGVSRLAARSGVWIASMMPVGAYDEAVYTGGSYVVDDHGRLVAQAPCFEQALLIQEVVRGSSSFDSDELVPPSCEADLMLWEALRLYVRGAVRGSGLSRAVVPLGDDLPHALLAVLAVDALGPRNVTGVLSLDEVAETASADALERMRASESRAMAGRLGVRVVERSVARLDALVDRDTGGAPRHVVRMAAACQLADVARSERAFVLLPVTKTDAALRPDAFLPAVAGGAAPFGDIALTALVRLASVRERLSAVLPARAKGDRAAADAMADVMDDVAAGLPVDRDCIAHARKMLGALDPMAVDAALIAHVEADRSLRELAFSGIEPNALALLLLAVRRGEAARRLLPSAPIVSRRSFFERSWPVSLGWADVEMRVDERPGAIELAKEARRRLEEIGEVRGAQARGEVVELMASLLGVSPEQLAAMASGGLDLDEAQVADLDEGMREALGRLMRRSKGDEGPGAFTFFSPN